MTHRARNIVPKGWQRCILPDFTRIVMGQSPPSKTYNRKGDGLPFFQGKAEFGDLFPTINLYCSKPNKIAKEGATLLSVRAPVGPTNLVQQECCIGRGLAALHPFGKIEPKFLLYYFRSIEPTISGKGTGSTFKAITKGFIEELEFDLPPLLEQRRIVAKINELFSELDNGIESLKAARAKLYVYRQAVLKHAFEGKLTAQWREENTDKIEQPEQLLTRIKQEREARYKSIIHDYQKALEDWLAGSKKGKKPDKPKRPHDMAPLEHHEKEKLPSLPQEWAFGRMGLYIDHIDAGKSFKCLEQEPSGDQVGVAKVSAVTWGEYDEKESKTCIDPDKINENLFIREGDFLLSRANTIELVGATVIAARVAKRIMLSDKTLRIHFTPEVSHFFLYYLRSPYGRNELEARSTGNQESMRNIGQDRIKSIVLPVCTEIEQAEIVRILNVLLHATERLETEIGTALTRTDALRQSILKKAFSGQLVAQDPNDEPASVLLERIRTEREKAANSSRSSKVKKRKTFA